MATVMVRQATDMTTLPTSLSGITISSIQPHGPEFEVRGNQGYADCLGDFTAGSGVISGTITQAVIDNQDFMDFPNLDITGLSYNLTGSFYSNVVVGGDLYNFVASLLGGSDTIIGSSGSDKLLGFEGNDTINGGA